MIKEERRRMYELLIQEDQDELILDGYKITRVEPSIQTRTVNKETLINILSEKIQDSDLIGEILLEALKDSEISSGIRLRKTN